jgi:hypothetical protein
MTITDQISKGNFICLNFPQQLGRDENFLQVPETQLENSHGGWGAFWFSSQYDSSSKHMRKKPLEVQGYNMFLRIVSENYEFLVG